MSKRETRRSFRQLARIIVPLLLVLGLLGVPTAGARASETVVGATPTISDTKPRVDQVLTAIPGEWGPESVTLSYQWARVSSKGKTSTISGATSAEYRVNAADVGYKLKVTVRGVSDGYTPVAKTSANTSAVVKGTFTKTPKPTVSGVARVGMTLTADPGAYDPSATYTYAWYRGSKAISKATKATYTATSSDKGKQLKVRVVASRAGFNSVTQYSDATAAVASGMTAVTPVISPKAPKVGQTLSITKLDAWSPNPDSFTYQWYRGSTAIAGATAATYTATGADLGKKLKVTVTGAKADYAPVSSTSAATSAVAAGTFTMRQAPTISGRAEVGQTVEAVEGVWTPDPDSFTYQWYRSGTAISGAKNRSYVIAAADAQTAHREGYCGQVGVTSVTATSAAVTAVESAAGDLRWPRFSLSGKNNDRTQPASTGCGRSGSRLWSRRSSARTPMSSACRRRTRERPNPSTFRFGTRSTKPGTRTRLPTPTGALHARPGSCTTPPR